MKTMKRIAGIGFAVAFLMAVTSTVSAQNGAKGGGAKLIESKAPVAAVEKEIVTPKMACPKCKESYSTKRDLSARGANKPLVFVATHLCAGCGTEWSVVGHGKAKTQVATHTCESCAAALASCCKTEAGPIATKGMKNTFQVAPLK